MKTSKIIYGIVMILCIALFFTVPFLDMDFDCAGALWFLSMMGVVIFSALLFDVGNGEGLKDWRHDTHHEG